MQSLETLDARIARVQSLQQQLTDPPSPYDVGIWVASLEARRSLEDELIHELAQLGAATMALMAEGGAAALAAALPGAPAPPEAATPPPAALPSEGPAPAEPPRAPTVPPDPVPAAPSPPPVAVTDTVLRTLQRGMSGALSQPEDTVAAAKKARSLTDAVLRGALATLGPSPADLVTDEAIHHEATRLRAIDEVLLTGWGQAQREANHALTTWVAARLRAVQIADESRPGRPVMDFGRLFRALGQHSKRTQPGSVRGLALSHQPRGASWLHDAQTQETVVRHLAGDLAPPEVPTLNPDDALRRLNEAVKADALTPTDFCAQVKALLRGGVSATDRRLVRMAMPFAGDLDGKRLAPLRRAIRELLKADDTDEDSRPPAVPTDWPHFGLTRGKTVMIVGGEPRPERIVRLKAAFDFGSLDWLDNPTQGVRAVDGVVQKMRSGTLDLVIVLRAFSSHKVSDKIFANRGPGCDVILADTYGINQVRFGIERFLGRASERS